MAIAAATSCAACVKGAGYFAGHEDRYELSLGTRDRVPKKRKLQEIKPTRDSEREAVKRAFFAEEAKLTTKVQKRRTKNAAGSRDTLKLH